MCDMNNDIGHRRFTRRKVLRAGSRSAAAIVAASLVAGCTVLEARDDDRYVVEITTRARYEPSGLTVPVGTTVVWRNMDEIPHTATTDPNLLPDPTRTSIPDGAEVWDSGEIMPGDRWTYTFTVPGTYVYGCQYHQADGMVGTVTVEGEEA